MIAALLSPWPDRADGVIAWQVTYEDVEMGNGLGFDDPTFGVDRRDTFAAALDYINTVVDAPGAVELVVRESQTDGNGYLAAATTLFPDSSLGTHFPGELYYAAHNDARFDGDDLFITFDFGYDWNSQLDAPQSGEADLFSVALHETTHGMGLTSLLGLNDEGDDVISVISGSEPGVFSAFDRFIERANGTKLFPAPGNFVGSVGDLTGDLFFAGPAATAANGGDRVELYTPDPYREGSSISHITGDPNYVMNAGIPLGQARRTYTDVEIGILQDIGWALQPFPGLAVGDVNLDGQLNALDIDAFLAVVAGGGGGDPAASFAADADANGRVDLLDINPFLARIARGIAGDANLDGHVDELDIAPFIGLLSNGAGGDPTTSLLADLDGSGGVNLLDINPFLERLEPAAPAQAAHPEPASLGPLAVGLTLAAARRRRARARSTRAGR